MASRGGSVVILAIVCFLSISALSAYIFSESTGAMSLWMQQAQARRIVDTPKGPFSLFNEYWHIDFLDKVWGEINVAFIPSTMEVDPVSWWQMFSFLADAAPLYAVWVLESNRKANTWTTAYLPAMFAMVFQVVGGCIIGPFYYIGHILTCPLPSTYTPKSRAIEMSNAKTLGFSLFLTYYVFYIGAYLSPSNETRHWYIWPWQMFPLWVGLSQVLLSSVVSQFGSDTCRGDADGAAEMGWVRLAVIGPGSFSALVWIYTVFNAPYPMREIMLPQALVVTKTPLEALRNILQWDDIMFFTAFFLWLLFLVSDLRRGGFTRSSWLTWAAILMPLTVAIGPGAALSLGWLAREEILAKGDFNQSPNSKKAQ